MSIPAANTDLRQGGGGGLVLLNDMSFVPEEIVYDGASGKHPKYLLITAVPDQSVCPLPGDCELTVEFTGGAKRTFAFIRSEDNPDFLTSGDPILTAALLEDGQVELRLPNRGEDDALILSDQDVMELQRSNSISDWLADVSSLMEL